EIDGVFVAHRVIKIWRHNGRSLIIQKGDAGGQAAVIGSEAVAGRVAAIEKKGRLLSIENGRGRVLNEISGFKNTFSCLLNSKAAVRRGKPGPEQPPGVFRILSKPYRVVNRLLVKIFFA
ncbi:MAG: hypothetical protein GXP46_09095, partial [Deferribacteres bacterium]|nr:hypothetical protein [Deferribacteres bacterium]